jgi:hypothetical protein
MARVDRISFHHFWGELEGGGGGGWGFGGDLESWLELSCENALVLIILIYSIRYI